MSVLSCPIPDVGLRCELPVGTSVVKAERRQTESKRATYMGKDTTDTANQWLLDRGGTKQHCRERDRE